MATVKQTHWQSIQQNIWLIGGVLSLVLAIIFWFMTDTKELTTQSKKVEDTPVSIQPEKVAATTNLGGLTEEVRPLQTTTRLIASGNHLAEFRGTKFIKENHKETLAQVFTEVRYKKSDNECMSVTLKETLKKQGFEK